MFFHNLFNNYIPLFLPSLKFNTYNIMSVIQSIRDRGAWIVFAVIALALIAFILQDGMGRKGGSMFGNSSSLGKVNGVAIDREEFEKKVTMYSQNGQDRNNVIGQLWNMEVDRIILNQEAEKLGFSTIFVSKYNKISLKGADIQIKLVSKIEDIASELFG